MNQVRDEQIFNLIQAENERQSHNIELIPSENFVSKQVLEVLGSVLTNKYSEGYPGKRYYGGQQNTDQVEQLAIDRAKQIFGADHANVQSHSGAQANAAVYFAWCQPGDTILAMDLAHGGHLTHGASVTQTAREYNFVHYGVTDAESAEIDFDQVEKLALEHRPKILLVGFSAYMKKVDFDKFRAIGEKVGAMLMADMSHVAGLIAGGQYDNPLQHGFHVMTTTTHKTLRGPRGGMILSMGRVTNPLKKPDKTLENLPTLIDRAVFPGVQGGPHMHAIAAKAVCLFEAMQPEFQDYAAQIVKNAAAMAEVFAKNNVVMIGGGTENHLILIDSVKSFGIDGRQAQTKLEQRGITANSNAIPFDTQPPFRPSGIRLGTPAMTSHGLKEADFSNIAQQIVDILRG